MKPNGDGGEGTFETVRRRYEQYAENRPAKAAYRRPSPVADEGGSDIFRLAVAGLGIGLGVVLLLLAGYAFWVAWQWNGYAHNGAAVGYTLVGFFLTVAGLGGIVATWHHNFRVLDPNRAPAHTHH